MENAREIYESEGKPENYNPDNFIYLSSNQYAYTQGVVGVMEREKVAANILCGSYGGEALLIAETGARLGCIQIAGSTGQLPMFIVTCDYVLIGEEFLTAAAYVTGDPVQLGSIRGQDFGKILVLVLSVSLSILLTLGVNWTSIFKW
jgi:hypothetical protein